MKFVVKWRYVFSKQSELICKILSLTGISLRSLIFTNLSEERKRCNLNYLLQTSFYISFISNVSRKTPRYHLALRNIMKDVSVPAEIVILIPSNFKNNVNEISQKIKEMNLKLMICPSKLMQCNISLLVGERRIPDIDDKNWGSIEWQWYVVPW